MGRIKRYEIVFQVSSSASTLVSLFGPSVAELGVGGVAGFAVGYALKKILKLLMILGGIALGMFIGGLYLLQRIGAIGTINYQAIYQAASGAGSNVATWGAAQLGSLSTFASAISLTFTGFAVGGMLGLQKG